MFDMLNPFSIHLRWQIVWIYLTLNHSIAEIGSLFCFSEGTVWRYIALFRQTCMLYCNRESIGQKDCSISYWKIINSKKAQESVWSLCKLSNVLQDSAINGLHLSYHATCRYPVLRHPSWLTYPYVILECGWMREEHSARIWIQLAQFGKCAGRLEGINIT